MAIRLDLGTASKILSIIPQPWKAIHIAGTNGKGSIAYFLSRLLAASRLQTGVFTTPHLIHPRESIKISDRELNRRIIPISTYGYDSYMHLARKGASNLGLELTEFEMLTAAAFLAFSDPAGRRTFAEVCGIRGLKLYRGDSVQMAVIECGVGGARDATNAMDAPRACTIISSIGLDHQDLLGPTLADIARHKAGIMRPRVPCFAVTPSSPEVKKVLVEEARKIRARLIFVSVRDRESIAQHFPPEIHQKLPPHQLVNLTVAVTALRCIMFKRREIASWNIPQLVSRFVERPGPPGRLQSVALKGLGEVEDHTYYHDPPILIDGAHNPDSGAALGMYVRKHFRGSTHHDPVMWLIAMSDNREPEPFLRALGMQKDDAVYSLGYPPVPSMPWVKSADPKVLLQAADKIMGVPEGVPEPARVSFANFNHETEAMYKESLLRDVLKLAVKQGEYTRCGGRTVVTGSLYLISYFLEHFSSDLDFETKIEILGPETEAKSPSSIWKPSHANR